jgi:hypothetical protein
MGDVESIIRDYRVATNPMDRYASFDYCYGYFLRTKDLTKDVEKSCLVLGFYLASWGMYRGSSFILQRSVKYLQPTIEYIATLDKKIWEIDVDNYENEKQTIIDIYKEVKALLIKNNEADLTLVTKILLGVFGFIPAFDSYFCDTFRNHYKGKSGFRRVDENSLSCIQDFYDKNMETIDKLADETYVIDFITGNLIDIKYTKAKIIDMYGFQKGIKNKTNR